MQARHLIGACRQGTEPGFKHDNILVLTSLQGCGKGKTIAALIPKEEWADSATKIPKTLEDREFLAKINGCWLFKFDEIDKITIGRDAVEMKGFITRRTDKYVEKWQTQAIAYPRRSVLFGSSNHKELLNDHTGDRRFWIVICGECNPEWVRANRDSIWATALTWMQWGGLNWVPQQHPLARAAAERAREARISKPLEGVIRDILTKIPKFENGISQIDIIRKAYEGLDNKDITRDRQMLVDRIITGNGFTTHDGKYSWTRKKRRYESASPRSGYIPVAVVSEQPVPTRSMEGWNCKSHWWRKDLTELFQALQPFNEVDEARYSTTAADPFGEAAEPEQQKELQPIEVGTVGTHGQPQCHASDVAEEQKVEISRTVPDGHTPIRVNGEDGWSIPSAASLTASPEALVVAVDRRGKTRSIKRKEIDG